MRRRARRTGVVQRALEHWHRWFAWHPVKAKRKNRTSYVWLWLEPVMRKGARRWCSDGGYWVWTYETEEKVPAQPPPRQAETPVPMICFEHGGSPNSAEINKQNGFECPKCAPPPLETEPAPAMQGKTVGELVEVIKACARCWGISEEGEHALSELARIAGEGRRFGLTNPIG